MPTSCQPPVSTTTTTPTSSKATAAATAATPSPLSRQQPQPGTSRVTPTGDAKDATADSATPKIKKSKRVAFGNKKFYLDFRSRHHSSEIIKQLAADIQALGGTIDDFFSKDIQVVVSDAPDWKIKSVTAKSPSSAAGLPPPLPSPLGGGTPPTKSPGTPSTLANLLSPWSPVNADEVKKTPRSRVDTILERSRSQHQAKSPGGAGSGDLLDHAQKWGVSVWPVQKVLDFFVRLRSRHGGQLKRHGPLAHAQQQQHQQRRQQHPAHTRSHSFDAGLSQSQSVRRLEAPFLKLEVAGGQLRPVTQEFKRRFPQLCVDGRAGTSPFYSPDRSAAAAAATAAANAATNNAKTGQKRLSLPDEDGRQEHRDKRKQQQPKSIRQSLFSPKRSGRSQQQPDKEQAAPEPEEPPIKVTKLKRKPNGFCEICDKSFEDFQTHVGSSRHTKVTNQNSYWASVDKCLKLINSGAGAAGDQQ